MKLKKIVRWVEALHEKTLLKKILSIITVLCYIVTIGVGYLYYSYSGEINRIFDVGVLIKTQFLHETTTEQLLEGAARGMVESLEDPYSLYMDAQEYKDLQKYIKGTFGGVGIFVEYTKEKKLVVSSAIEGKPAALAGIKSGDVIVTIGGVFTSELTYEETIARMRGELGTAVTLGILREGTAELLEFTLIREELAEQLVESTVLEDNIGYMRIKIFSSNSDEAVWEQLQVLWDKGIKGLVLDLRDNPGGELDPAVNIANYFISGGTLVYIVDKSGETTSYAEADAEKLGLPLVVLINGGSASASEVLSGAIKDYDVGTLIGEKSFGKGIVQGIFNLEGGEGLKLTTSKYLTPNKIDIHEKGIEPDIVVTPSMEDTEDVQLRMGLDYLKGEIK